MRIARWLVAGTLLGIVGLFLVCAPTSPRSATPAELGELESIFPSMRDTLERRILLYREGIHLANIRDSLFAAGESLRVRQLERDYNARLSQFRRMSDGPGAGGAISESLIYIEAWARRGRGFDAPWSSAGYVYSSRPGFKAPLFRKHLGGNWYLYSMPAEASWGGGD